jgi:hypothetical protein
MSGNSGPGSDWVAITEALHSYAFHFDRNEPEAVGDLFTADAMIDYGPEMDNVIGGKALTEVVGRGLRTIFAATSHHISNPIVTIDGDDATLIAYLYAWHRYHDGSPDGYLWGQYHTKLRKTPAGWRFTELVLKIAGMHEFHRGIMHPIGRLD